MYIRVEAWLRIFLIKISGIFLPPGSAEGSTATYSRAPGWPISAECILHHYLPRSGGLNKKRQGYIYICLRNDKRNDIGILHLFSLLEETVQSLRRDFSK